MLSILKKRKKILSILSGVSIVIVIYELYNYKKSKRRIKTQILKLICQSQSKEFESFYNFNLNKINKEMLEYNQEQLNYFLVSINKSFYLPKPSNLTSSFNKIRSFNNFRSLDNPELFDLCIHNIGANQYISCIDNMLYFPLIFKIGITIFNILVFWRLKLSWKAFMINNYHIPILVINKDKNLNFDNKKVLIIFLGLGGVLDPFLKIIEFFVKKNYVIIIPIYQPSQADWYCDNSIHEAQFYKYLTNFLIPNKIFEIEILAWSMGGIIYKGFEKYLSLQKHHHIEIKRVFLFEPLITTRAAIDTYFSQIRSYKSTLEIFNSFTRNKYRYFNLVFSYILHTEIGFFASNSIGYFSSIELINSFKENYPRYIFISENDIIFNSHSDKQILKSNFKDECVFSDGGYHGSWLYKNKLLIPKLEQIVK